MYHDFHEQFEAWFDAAHVARPRLDTLDEVPAFLLQPPANEDDALTSIAILGEN